jgi:plasmid stabilization system protein ParE
VRFEVELSLDAQDDLLRLHDHLLARELARDGDLGLADEAVATIQGCFKMLERFPFTCRKAADSSFLRELVIDFGHTGYVALFEILSKDRVVIAAIRHQREDDYH